MKLITITVVETKLPAAFLWGGMLLLMKNGRVVALLSMPCLLQMCAGTGLPPYLDLGLGSVWTMHMTAWFHPVLEILLIFWLFVSWKRCYEELLQKPDIWVWFSCKEKFSQFNFLKWHICAVIIEFLLWTKGNFDMYVFYISCFSHSYGKITDKSNVRQMSILAHSLRLTSISPQNGLEGHDVICFLEHREIEAGAQLLLPPCPLYSI